MAPDVCVRGVVVTDCVDAGELLMRIPLTCCVLEGNDNQELGDDNMPWVLRFLYTPEF